MIPELKLNPLLSRKSGATELYLIRHADALPGEETIIPGQGYDDQPLSLLGRRQAQALSQGWQDTAFDAIYSSPLRRTLETAAPLAERQNLEVRVEASLREVRLGIDAGGPDPADGPGATAASLRARLDRIVRQVGQGGKWSAIPGSEESEPFRARVVEVILAIAGRHAGGRVAVFSHGGVINAFVAQLLGQERDFFFPIYNTSVTIVRCLGAEASLVGLNEISHLRRFNIELD